MVRTEVGSPSAGGATATPLAKVLEPWLAGHRVSVVIPAWNEADNLPLVLTRLPACVDEVILVDGHSTDDTIAIAQQYRPDIRVVVQTGHGKGDALRCGIRAATGDLIVLMDADGSTDPSEIPLFLETLLAGADFAKGSRFLTGGGTDDMPFYRKVGNWAFILLVRLLFGRQFTDMCYGYNALRMRPLRALDLDAQGFEIETMMNIRALCAGLRIVEVPSFEDRRVFGQGRLRTIPDGWRVLMTIGREWLAHRVGWRRLRPAPRLALSPDRPVEVPPTSDAA